MKHNATTLNDKIKYCLAITLVCNTLSIREGAPATPTIIGVGRKGAGSDRKRARLARLFKYTLGVKRMVETTFRNKCRVGSDGK